MKIIIDARLLLPKMTGIGRYLMGIAQGFSRIGGDYNFEFWLQKDLPEDHPVWRYTKDYLNFRRLRINHMVLAGHWQIPTALRSTSHDLFHYPHFDLPILTPRNIIVTIHDLKYIAYPQFFPQFSSAKRLIVWGMMYVAVRKANCIITVSTSSKNDIVSYLKIKPEKVVVIPEGVGKEFNFQFEQTNITLVLDRYQVRQPFFLFVGEKRPHKNLVAAIKAFALFSKEVGHTHQFVISGKPYGDYDEPEQCAKSLDIEEQVRFVYVSDEDLPVMYQAAEAFITLSLYEGFGLPLLEAMASGTPVIAANRTSLPEIVAEAGILVDPNQIQQVVAAMVELIQSNDLRDRLIQAGLGRAAEHSWEKCALKTIDVYQQALNSL